MDRLRVFVDTLVFEGVLLPVCGLGCNVKREQLQKGPWAWFFFVWRGSYCFISFYCCFVLNIPPLDWSLHAVLPMGFKRGKSYPLCRRIGACWPEVPVFGSLVFLCFCARPFFCFLHILFFYYSIILCVCALIAWTLLFRLFLKGVSSMVVCLVVWCRQSPTGWCLSSFLSVSGVSYRCFLLLWVVAIVRLMIERVVAVAL